jgi:hypothetical protein
MTERIRVHTIGHCTIEIGDRTLTPAADRLFCLALILTAYRGASITREEMGDLLWDEPASSRDPHALRQLIYRLRQMGFPLREDRDGAMMVDVTKWDETASTDFTLARYHAELVSVPAGRFAWLPGYRTATVATSRWIEFERLLRHGQIRRELHAALTAAEAKSHWAMVERYGEHLVALDPCNEDAVEALAVACALLGAKREALRVLDRFRAETESSEEWVSASAMRLRRRVQAIEEATDEVGYPLPVLIGRDQLRNELQQLVRGLPAERAGRLALISGMHGMGKTRLAGELRIFAQMAGAAVCSLPTPTTSGRSVLEQCIGWLLDAPGALGASPEMLARLRASQVDGVLRQASGPLRRAITEVLWAIADEAPVVVVIDDVVARDRRALSLLVQAIADVRAPVLGVMLGVPSGIRALAVPSDVPVYPGELDALTAEESAVLLSAWLESLSPHKPLDQEGRTRILAHAAGTPAFLELWVRHWVATDSVAQVPPTVVSGMEAMRREEGGAAGIDSDAANNRPSASDFETAVPPIHVDRSAADLRGHVEICGQPLARQSAQARSAPRTERSREGSRSEQHTESDLLLRRYWKLPRGPLRHAGQHLAIARALIRSSAPHVAIDLMAACLSRSGGRDTRVRLLPTAIEASLVGGQLSDASALFDEFRSIAVSPGACTTQVARSWLHIALTSFSMVALIDRATLLDQLATLLGRDDMPDGARVRAAVCYIKAAEDSRARRKSVLSAKRVIISVCRRRGFRTTRAIEGLMCFEAYHGTRESTTRLVRELDASLLASHSAASKAASIGNAGTAATLVGDVLLARRCFERARDYSISSGSPAEIAFAAHRLSRHELDFGNPEDAHKVAVAGGVNRLDLATNGTMPVLAGLHFAMLSAARGDAQSARRHMQALQSPRKDRGNDHATIVARVSEVEANRLADGSVHVESLEESKSVLIRLSKNKLFDNCAALLSRSIESTQSRECATSFLAEYMTARGKPHVPCSQLLYRALA